MPRSPALEAAARQGWDTFDDRSYGEPTGVPCVFCGKPIEEGGPEYGKDQPSGPVAHEECLEAAFSRETNPLGECFLDASRCPRCARAEREGQPVIDRHGTMHAPQKMRNPCHGRRKNIGLPGKTGPGDLYEWKGQVDRRTFEKRLMARWPDLEMDDSGLSFGDPVLYYSMKESTGHGLARHVASWQSGSGWIFNMNHRHGNPNLLLLTNPPVMLLRKEDRKNLPPLYSQEHNPDPTVWVKLFTPYSSFSFFILEYDQQDTMFGWTDPGPGGDAELGYISLGELAALKGPGGTQGVERDRFWKPAPLSKVKSRMVNPTPPRKTMALVPSERGKFCDHRLAAYSGRIPLTGPIYCKMCGTHLPDDFFQRRKKNPSAPPRIKNAWEKFHQTGFTGDAREIPDIPGAPSDLMALGEFVDAVTDSGRRWSGGPHTRLCYEPADKSLWVVSLSAADSGILHTGRTRGESLATVAYRTFGKSGKDHAVYEHRFHRPHPVVVSVHPRAAMLDGGRYVVTDWIRR